MSSSRRVGVFATQAAELVERLPLHVEEVCQFVMRRLVSSIFSAQLALRAFDHLLLTAKLVVLLLERIVPLVELAFAFVAALAAAG